MSVISVVAPHPDDETFGCGGLMLKARKAGHELHWIIATAMTEQLFTAERRAKREAEIAAVAEAYGFASVQRLGLPAAQLDAIPMGDIVAKMAAAVRETGTEILYLPNRSDVHTDHRIVFDAGAACAKWFRFPKVRQVLAYETLSETDAAVPYGESFRPNVFVDITEFLARKLEIAELFEGEVLAYPFPRSREAIEALARVRGVAAGYHAAEAFQLLRSLE